jgi:hypothetical protein
MPFKSQAQRRKFAELLLKGEISNKTFEEWNRETGSARLPERVRGQGQPEVKREKAQVPDKDYTNEGQAPLGVIQPKASLRFPGFICRARGVSSIALTAQELFC